MPRNHKGGKIAVKDLNKLLNESYKNIKNTNKNIDGRYILDTDLSTDKTKIYKDTVNNDIKIVNRGTSDVKDVLTDAKLLFGFKDKSRFNEAKDILNKVKEKYKDENIDVLGHSLGATVAEDIGKDPRIKNIITLNKPTTPLNLLNREKQDIKQYDISTKNDAISLLKPFQYNYNNDIIIPSNTGNLYAEHKIDVLDRLPQEQIIGTGINTGNIPSKLIKTSNFDLINLAKYLNIPLNDVIMKDEINKINNLGFYISNLDNSNNNGTHWTVFFYHPLTSYYYDSFGFVPPLEIENKIKPYYFNNNDIQDYNSEACGYYCLAFIKFLHNKQDKKEAYNQFIKLFHKTDLKENDKKLKNFLFN